MINFNKEVEKEPRLGSKESTIKLLSSKLARTAVFSYLFQPSENLVGMGRTQSDVDLTTKFVAETTIANLVSLLSTEDLNLLSRALVLIDIDTTATILKKQNNNFNYLLTSIQVKEEKDFSTLVVDRESMGFVNHSSPIVQKTKEKTWLGQEEMRKDKTLFVSPFGFDSKKTEKVINTLLKLEDKVINSVYVSKKVNSMGLGLFSGGKPVNLRSIYRDKYSFESIRTNNVLLQNLVSGVLIEVTGSIEHSIFWETQTNNIRFVVDDSMYKGKNLLKLCNAVNHIFKRVDVKLEIYLTKEIKDSLVEIETGLKEYLTNLGRYKDSPLNVTTPYANSKEESKDFIYLISKFKTL